MAAVNRSGWMMMAKDSFGRIVIGAERMVGCYVIESVSLGYCVTGI